MNVVKFKKILFLVISKAHLAGISLVAFATQWKIRNQSICISAVSDIEEK